MLRPRAIHLAVADLFGNYLIPGKLTAAMMVRCVRDLIATSRLGKALTEVFFEASEEHRWWWPGRRGCDDRNSRVHRAVVLFDQAAGWGSCPR